MNVRWIYMDCSKVGKLILSLRKEKNMTQKELADAMNLSDRTVSKWERGVGCPDVTLLSGLSNILGVNIERILAGDLDPNDNDGGNVNKVKFYVCPTCGNILFSTSEADTSCCGRKLTALTAKSELDGHVITIEEIEDDYFITIDHEMVRAHYISFVAFIGYDRVLIVKLYPEQNAELRFPKMHGKKLFAYCNNHGLFEYTIKN
jgi:transcriptional regulator with XRE-family HTH domain/desulfoferrodoxin (superoxide reductase-like protein)